MTGRARKSKVKSSAMLWRERMGLTVAQLEKLSGYSREAIYRFEAGRRTDGNHSGYSVQRYRLVCAGIEADRQLAERLSDDVHGGRKVAW